MLSKLMNYFREKLLNKYIRALVRWAIGLLGGVLIGMHVDPELVGKFIPLAQEVAIAVSMSLAALIMSFIDKKKNAIKLVPIAFLLLSLASNVRAEAKHDKPFTTGDEGKMCMVVRNDDAATARATTNGNYEPASADAYGRIWVRSPGDIPNEESVQERVSNTDGASTALTNFGATASKRNMISAYACLNSSATAGYLDLRDGTSGAIIWTIPLPAGSGAVQSFPSPIRQPTVNTALAFDVSAALSTVYCSFKGYKSTT